MSRFGTVRLAITAAALIGAACDGDVDTGATDTTEAPETIGDECVLAAVCSDYVSSTVSLLARDGALCADGLVHSGSAAPGVVTALSGDVQLPTTRHPGGLLTLIDRFPNSVMTLVDVAAEDITQHSVGTGFASNPQDIAFLSSDKAYVTRADTNATPTADPSDHDEGGDILVIDPSAAPPQGRADVDKAVLGRIDLTAYVDTPAGGDALHPRPGRMAITKGGVVVGLGHLAPDLLSGGEGRIVLVDASEDRVTRWWQLPSHKNCGTAAAPAPSGDGAWIVCSGIFGDGVGRQTYYSGIVYVDVTGAEPDVTWQGSADDGPRTPFGFSIAPIDEDRAAVAVLGDLQDPTPDRVFIVDRKADTMTSIGVTFDPFTVGTVLFDGAGDTLLVTDGDPIDPKIRRFSIATDRVSALEAWRPCPSSGLPPRALRAFR